MKRSLIFIICVMVSTTNNLLAQRAAIRNQIEQNMRDKHAEPQKAKGQKALDDITYENDKRFENFKNTQYATIIFNTEFYDNKGAVKSKSQDAYMFGKRGECYIINYNDKNESRMIFDYIDKANYIVAVNSNSVTKMPLINMRKKLVEEQAKKAAHNEKWSATNEKKWINGYACTKYIYTADNGDYIEYWVTQQHVVTINPLFIYGNQINYLTVKDASNIPKVFMISSSLYKKNGKLQHTRTLSFVSEKVDENIFDITSYKINDVLEALK